LTLLLKKFNYMPPNRVLEPKMKKWMAQTKNDAKRRHLKSIFITVFYAIALNNKVFLY